MKRALYLLGAVASLACAWFFVRALVSHWNAVADIRWNAGVLRAVIAALLLYACTYLVGAAAWQQCLRALRRPLSYGDAAIVLAVSQLAKYLPGNVGHHIGRVAMARGAGIPADLAVASVLLETLLVLVAGSLCALPALGLLRTVGQARLAGRFNGSMPSAWTVAALCIVAAVVLVGWWWRRQATARRLAVVPSPAPLGIGATCLCASFALGGTALYLLCGALSPAAASARSAVPWLDVVGVYAAAWLAGFLVPGSPAGLGVRELVLLLGLSPAYGASSATMAAALLRLVTVAGDGVVFAAGWLARMRMLRRPGRAARSGQLP